MYSLTVPSVDKGTHGLQRLLCFCALLSSLTVAPLRLAQRQIFSLQTSFGTWRLEISAQARPQDEVLLDVGQGRERSMRCNFDPSGRVCSCQPKVYFFKSIAASHTASYVLYEMPFFVVRSAVCSRSRCIKKNKFFLFSPTFLDPASSEYMERRGQVSDCRAVRTTATCPPPDFRIKNKSKLR